MIGVNLIPTARLVRRSRTVRARAWAYGALAAVALSAGGALTFRVVSRDDRENIRTQIEAARARTAAAEATLVKVQASLSQARKAVEAAQLIGDHPDWSRLLRAISDVRGGRVSLEVVELRAVPREGGAANPRADRYTLKIRAIASDYPSTMAFVGELERLRPLRSVTLKESRVQTLRGVEVTGFELECVLAEQPAPEAGGARAEVGP